MKTKWPKTVATSRRTKNYTQSSQQRNLLTQFWGNSERNGFNVDETHNHWKQESQVSNRSPEDKLLLASGKSPLKCLFSWSSLSVVLAFLLMMTMLIPTAVIAFWKLILLKRKEKRRKVVSLLRSLLPLTSLKVRWTWFLPLLSCNDIEITTIPFAMCKNQRCVESLNSNLLSSWLNIRHFSHKLNEPGIYKNNFRWDSNPCLQRTSNVQALKSRQSLFVGKHL